MADVVYSPRFANELARVMSPRIESKVYGVLSILETTPAIGSAYIPSSIRAEFGAHVLKMVIDPFDLFYEYFEDADVVYVYTLVLQRQAR